MDEETLKQMFNNSNVKNDKVNMSKDESDRFQKAFEDPGNNDNNHNINNNNSNYNCSYNN
jgi:hypothetical protein